MGGRQAKLIVLCAVALAFVLRLVFALDYWVGKPLTKDEQEYLSLADSLAQGRGFVYGEDVLAWQAEPVDRAPGYPLFLALAGGGRQLTEAVPTSVKVAQSLVGAVGVLLIGIVAATLAGPRAGCVSAMFAACYPPLVWISAYALSEVVLWPIGLALVLLFDRGDWPGRGAAWGSCLACGALAGAAALVHPTMLFLVLLAVAWLLWRKRFAPAGVFALAALLVIAPWTVRNYRHDGRFVLIASEGGVTFWTGNHPRARGEGDLAANPELGRDRQVLRAQHLDLTRTQMDAVYYREALIWIRAHPFDWLLLEARKLFYLVVPIGRSYRLHSAKYFWASVISYGVVVPIAVVGFLRLRSRRARLPALWLIAGSSVVAALTFFPQERFRIPLIDPVLVTCAGAAWADHKRRD